MNEKLQSELAGVDPVSGGEDAGLRYLMYRMARDAQEVATAESAVRRPWWKRTRALIPLSIAGVIALTGAAVAIPLGLWVSGTKVEFDAEIPIAYATDTGIDVNCRYGIYFGDPTIRSAADEQLADFVHEHDWTGIGQRIYAEAIAHPFVPGPDDHLEVDTPKVRDQFSFTHATGLIWEEIPVALRQAGYSSASTMDCKGLLH